MYVKALNGTCAALWKAGRYQKTQIKTNQPTKKLCANYIKVG